MPSNDEKILITNQQARRFLLSHHFLLPPKSLSTDNIIPSIFARLGCIQFDTINVVGRNADLVLQSRVENYQPEILEKLLYQDRVLIDGWDKVASIYATDDWPFFERHRNRMREQLHRRSPNASEVTTKVLKKIEANGHSSSLDFKDSTKTDWAWGPTSITRAALEILYAEGKLGIHHRVNTRRHFDLIERLIPSDLLQAPDPNPTDEQYQEWHVLRRIGGLGIASNKSGEHWLGIYGARKVSERKSVIQRLVEKNLVAQLVIDGIQPQTFYIRTEDVPKLSDLPQPPKPTNAAFLAPLDNLLWNRKLIKDIFNFQYTWEVYKPKNKREYGYYVLPVLYGEKFIARVDMKYDRKTKTLNLINWWWEEDIAPDDQMLSAVYQCTLDFIGYLGAENFQISSENLQAPEIGQLLKDIN